MSHITLRFLRTLALAIMLALVGLSAVPAHAQERIDQLPFVNNFATARCKRQASTSVGNLRTVSYGEGMIVMPDRMSLWMRSNNAKDLDYEIQIGNTVYQRTGNKPWKRSTRSIDNFQNQPTSAQFNALQQHADAIYHMGSEQVGQVPTEHYQVWLSGGKAFKMYGVSIDSLSRKDQELLKKLTYKYDLWVNPQDGFLYQQNIEFSLPSMKIDGKQTPALQMDILMTFYDINNPNIGVYPPR